MLTKGAFGNLINRYRAVLKKCNLINTFGSLAVASMLVLGGAGVASAANSTVEGSTDRTAAVAIFSDSGSQNVTWNLDANETKLISNTDSVKRVFGLALTYKSDKNRRSEEKSLTINADKSNTVKINVTPDTPANVDRVQGIRIDYGGKLTMNGGTLDITVDSAGSCEDDYDGVIGLANYHIANINADKTIINVTGDKGYVYGITNENYNTTDAILNSDGKLTINNLNAFVTAQSSNRTDIDGTINDGATAIDRVAGLNTNYGTNTLTGDYTKISVTNHADNFADVMGIVTQSDTGYNPATVNLNAKTTEITVTNDASGISKGVCGVRASGPGGVNFKGTTATITVDGGSAETFGIRSQYGSTVKSTANSTVNITATNSSSETAYALSVNKMNDVESHISMLGNTHASATNNGKGDAYGLYATKGTTVTLGSTGTTVSLTASSAKGTAYAIKSLAGSSITLNGNATLNGDVDAQGTLTINGTANLNGKADIAELAGKGSVVLNDTKSSVFADNAATAAATVEATGELNDQLGGDISKFQKQTNIKNLVMQEGLIAGEVTKNADGSVVKKVNTVLADTLEQATAAPLAVNRILMNDVRKRMGDLRADKNESGVWMRWDGGKLQGDGLSNDFNTIQLGGDTKVAKNCRFGVAGSFTHGDIDHSNGGGEMETYTFAAYGTWMAESGMFADVIARVGFTNSEIMAKGGKADIDNEAISLSGEYGWRLPVCEQFFVEPQVELTYTHVTGADFSIRTADYNVDSVDSLLGRAGLVAGWNLPNDMGNVYARASVVHEFLGDSKISATNNGGYAAHELDGDDTWIEYGIGANVKLTDKTYIWADVERTSGAELDEEWRGTVGIRVSF